MNLDVFPHTANSQLTLKTKYEKVLSIKVLSLSVKRVENIVTTTEIAHDEKILLYLGVNYVQ